MVLTRNNAVLLQHAFESFQKYNPGCGCDFLIADHESDNKQHLNALDVLSKKYRIVKYPNNRAEVTFNKVWKDNNNYQYYFFCHDDVSANKDNWLKVFVGRMNGGHVEKIIENTEFAKLKIGRVGNCHQPWRNYCQEAG